MNIDDRPQGLFTRFGKISNGHNSATRHPIPFMFGSRVGFSGTANRIAPFPVRSNSRWRPFWKKTWPCLSNASSDSLCMNTDYMLCPMIVGAYDRRLDTYFPSYDHGVL